MSKTRIALLLAATLIGAAAATTASAGGRASVSIGIGFGPAWYYPAWRPYPYAYPSYYYGPPYPVVVRQEPQVFIERDAAPESDAPQWWYYCAEAKAYYPYVKYCAAGWKKVAPQPPR